MKADFPLFSARKRVSLKAMIGLDALTVPRIKPNTAL